MERAIYLIQEDKSLIEMKEQAYDSEAILQELLAKYPSVLAGEQGVGVTPRRWLLISREMPVSSQEQGGPRWSLDHLFLDQDGIPTLVEVKRSGDTRIRREVVGQMLDYAANGVVYWPVETIRSSLVARCESQGVDPGQELGEFLGGEADEEQFWQAVKRNLTEGRVRLVFVADQVPPELRRIVEFLNEQMDPAEVLAIEVKQFVGQGLKTLVPAVIGQTAHAQLKKGSEGRKWDETMFIETLEKRGDTEGARAAREILEWARRRSLRIWWGEGTTDGSFFPVVNHQGIDYFPVAIRTGSRNSYIQVQFAPLSRRPPFDDDNKRQELRARLNAIPGVNITADATSRYPTIPMSALRGDASRKQFLETLDWLLTEIGVH